VIYLDSCALVKLVVAEPETAALRARLADHDTELVTSELALTEVIRVVRRSCYDARRRLRVDEDALQRRLTTAGDVLGEIDHVVVDTDTFLRAGMFADDPHLGSLDALHLVCALELGVALTAFVTYDKALANAAAHLGLPVEQPTP
jgi:predicted nucleic acid-binding protein